MVILTFLGLDNRVALLITIYFVGPGIGHTDGPTLIRF